MNRSMLAIVVGLSLGAKAFGDDEANVRLTAAPSDEYAVTWTKPAGPLRVVMVKNPSETTILDLPPWAQAWGNGTLVEPMPLPFISPDSNWIFVPTRTQLEVIFSPAVGSEYFEGAAILYHRAHSEEGTARFEAGMSDRFDQAAWEFLSRELKLKVTESTPDAHRVFSANFVDWSEDSGRLLIRVSSGVYSSSKRGWLESAVDGWYCYFNTRSGEFELTDRLRAADNNPVLNDFSTDDTAALTAVVIHAESIGKEGPEASPSQNFAEADKRLNEIYNLLMTQARPADREVLREEEREWIQSRDTEAELQVLERWMSDREASALKLESEAISTGTRVVALEKRLKKP
jgi:uncharacterized protein YecT (DUF1311 family)